MKHDHCTEIWQLGGPDADGSNLICDLAPGHPGSHRDPIDRIYWLPFPRPLITGSHPRQDGATVALHD